MDSDLGKLFVGGVSWETTQDKLRDYFEAYGEVVEAVVMKDRATGRARGFGFVVFADPAVADRVLQERHTLDGRMVEAKKAVPREEQQQNALRSSNAGVGTAARSRTRKIFVGGLAPSVTENDFKKYFSQFGAVTDVVVMYDPITQRPRGFGFVTYDCEDAVDNALQKSFHDLNGKMVEVKRAIPKELSPGPTRSNGATFSTGTVRAAGYGVGFGHGFSSSPAGGYGVRDIRYSSSPMGRVGYPPYSALGYGGGGYGAAMNGSFAGSPYGRGGGYGVSGGVAALGTTGYGGGLGIGGGYSNGTVSGGYANIGGRNVWGGGETVYARASTGYGGSGTAGVGGSGTRGSSLAPGSGASYGSSNYGYGGNGGGYIPSTAGGYTGRSTIYSSPIGGFGLGAGAGGSAGYSGGHGDAYGSSGYLDPTWRWSTANSYNSLGGKTSGAGGLTMLDSAGAAKGSMGYDATTRQFYQGVAV